MCIYNIEFVQICLILRTLFWYLLTFAGCGAVILCRLALDDAGDASSITEPPLAPSNEVIDKVAESLDPGIKPPGGKGGGGGGEGELPTPLRLVDTSDAEWGLFVGCCTVSATNFSAKNMKKDNGHYYHAVLAIN